MTVFTSLDKAVAEGFHWLEYRADVRMHLVERVFNRGDGRLVRAIALAQAEPATAAA